MNQARFSGLIRIRIRAFRAQRGKRIDDVPAVFAAGDYSPTNTP